MCGTAAATPIYRFDDMMATFAEHYAAVTMPRPTDHDELFPRWYQHEQRSCAAILAPQRQARAHFTA